MVLLNAAKRARYATSTINQNQGGGEKKAGAVYNIGRNSWTSIYFHERANCPLSSLQHTYHFARPSRPIGSDMRLGVYEY